MVHIIYARVDLNGHEDLKKWRDKELADKKEGDWKKLKEFLAIQPKFYDYEEEDIHPLPKCWYSELPQGDDYALDVEHFRPKNKAEPLSLSKVKQIEKLTGLKIEQELMNGAYPWLEFDYRNYRLTTARPNRGGAKHIYFPLACNSPQLSTNQFPWEHNEFNLLLDPTDGHDASLLIVLPNGRIEPRTLKTVLNDEDYNNLESNWRNNGFNYLRAWVTIIVYRLQDPIFVKARRKVYKQAVENIENLEESLICQSALLIGRHSKYLYEGSLPSAPFALATRSAIESYVVSIDSLVGKELEIILSRIKTKIENLTSEYEQSWDNL